MWAACRLCRPVRPPHAPGPAPCALRPRHPHVPLYICCNIRIHFTDSYNSVILTNSFKYHLYVLLLVFLVFRV